MRVSEFPLTGKKLETRQKNLFGLRAIPVNGFPNYIIYYVASNQIVLVARVLHGARVARVLHGARDLPRLMGVDP